MLQFIVLGKVPGTSFQLTFAWFLLFALIVSLLALVLVELAKIKQLLQRKPASGDQPSLG